MKTILLLAVSLAAFGQMPLPGPGGGTTSGVGTVTTSGTPTTNCLAKFTGVTIIGNAAICDDGANITATEPVIAPQVSTNGASPGLITFAGTGGTPGSVGVGCIAASCGSPSNLGFPTIDPVGAGYPLLSGAPSAGKMQTVWSLFSLNLAGNLATTGAFNTTFAQNGTATFGLPAANDTLVGRATTDTLTNKTLTSPALNNPVISGPAAVLCGTTCSPTTGTLTLLNQAAGSTVTLPTSSGSGNIIRLEISVALTSAQEKVLLATTTDTIIGMAIGENAGTAKVFVGNAGTYHSIQMPFSGTEPSGGFIGDQITCTDIATGKWSCNVNYQSGVTSTTPYSTSTT